MVLLKKSVYYNWLCECIRAHTNKLMDMTLKLVSKNSSFLVAKRMPEPKIVASLCSDDRFSRVKIGR